jgi:hypothetical protein
MDDQRAFGVLMKASPEIRSFSMFAELYLGEDLNVKIKSAPWAFAGKPANGRHFMLQA